VSFAELLYRFDTATRREVAKVIASLSYERAREVVRARSASPTEEAELPRRPRHLPDPALVTVGLATKAITDVSMRDTKRAIRGLDAASRTRLIHQFAMAQRRLAKLAAPDPASLDAAEGNP
jgi:hypothetical protein